MNQIGVVILSRYSSKRLPGKALMKINDKPILKYIVERLEQVFDKSDITIATSTQKEDDVIERFCIEEEIDCYRGSLDNVALRFYEAAREKNWKYAVRICGDNVFVNIEAIKLMLEKTETGNYDFLTNKKDQTYPYGLSVEIVNVKHFESQLDEINKVEKYREHVTLYYYENESGKHYYHYNTEVPEAAGIQLALDTKEDFETIENIIKRFNKPHWQYGLKEIIQIWKELGYGKSF